MSGKGREPPSEPGTKRMICTTSSQMFLQEMVVFRAWHSQVLAADNVTWLNAATAITTDGVASPTVPAGQYRLNVVGVSGLYVALSSIIPPP